MIEFLALECPPLIAAARRNPSRDAVLGAFEDAFAVGKDEAGRAIYPGATAADAAGWSRAALRELIEGYYRREELKASITPDEKRLMFRVMVLSRSLDDYLARLFREKTIAWEGIPSPQKGFRGLGQEAVVGLALRLRRGSEQGDIACPLIRGLPLTLIYTDDPEAV
ncbi:MAG TPA: hypothetical protein VG457_08010, partial [Planctomycetota bacterium]|nr:hypothetical protein [Planctomycetota bacterium]